MSARLGTLVLRVQPGDASVLVDDEPWRGSQSQDRLVIQLAEGAHRVRVEKDGISDVRRRSRRARGRDRQLQRQSVAR